MTQFTVGEAWSQTLAFMRDNIRMLIIVIGGVLLLVQVLELLVMGGAMSQGEQLAAIIEAYRSGSSAQLESTMVAQNAGLFAAPLALLAAILQAAGNFTALRLGIAHEDEGFGPAVSFGLGAAVLTMVAYMVVAVVAVIVIAVPLVLLGIGTAVAGGYGGGVVALLIIAVFCLMIWVMARLAVAAPAMAAVRSVNPLYGIAQSWALTRGHTMPIIGFYMLFVVVAIIAGVLLGGLTALITSIAGMILGSILGALVFSLPFGILSLSIQAGMFRTLVPDIAIGDVFG